MAKLLGLDNNNLSKGEPISLNMMDQPTLKCPTCEDILFETVFVLKRISKVLIGTPHDQIAPVQLFRCINCGSLIPESLPDPTMLDKILNT